MEQKDMNRCETCLYYVQAQFGDHRMTCKSPKIRRGYDREIPCDDGAMVEDDEEWGILVGPNFGCVNHKAKD